MLDHIKSKPEYIRKQYALGATIFIMFFVVLIWGYSLKQSLGGGGAVDAGGNLVVATDQAPSPFTAVKNIFSDAATSVGGLSASVKGAFSGANYTSTTTTNN